MAPVNPETVAASIRVAGPVFDSTFSRAPAQVKYNGRTYSRSKATTPEAKAWYLAAAAMHQPSALQKLAPAHLDRYGFEGGHFFLDADPSAMNDARTALTQARNEVRRIKGSQKNAKTALARAEYENKKCGTVDAGNILTLGINGAICGVQWRSEIRRWTDELLKLDQSLTDAKATEANAVEAYSQAKSAYDAENARMRAEEEAARQSAADASAQAAMAAQQQARQTMAATAPQQDYWPNEPTEADDAYYMDMADVYGADPTTALEHLDMTEGGDDAFNALVPLEAQNAAWAPLFYDSPYSFARYWCDCPTPKLQERMEFDGFSVFQADPTVSVGYAGKAETPSQYQSLGDLAPASLNDAFASKATQAEGPNLITLIIGAIMSIAPMILQAFMPQAPAPDPAPLVPAPDTTAGENSPLPLLVLAGIGAKLFGAF